MRRLGIGSALVVILALGLLAFARKTPLAASTSFEVRVVGHGPPVLLIPGLSCSGEMWDSTVAHLQDHFRCYVFSIAGFGGRPPLRPLPASFLPRVRDDILAYLRDQHIEHPVIIGHSLGGAMALWLAETAPDVPAGLIIVDSLPFTAATIDPHATVHGVQASTRKLLPRLRWAPDWVIQVGEWREVFVMVHSWSDVWHLGRIVTRSDRATSTQALVELLTTDLRPALGKITCPVLVLKALGDRPHPPQKEALRQITRTQYAGLPQTRIQFFDTSRHFIMNDDPAGYFTAVDAFLAAHP